MKMKKTAVITGASGGIGGAAAIQLAKEGYSLALLGHRSKEKLQKVKQACMNAQPNSDAVIFSLCGDLSNAKEAGQLIQKAVESLGHVDLFLHCAGISHIGLLTDMSDEEWMNVINSDLSSVFYCCRKVVPYMISKKKGRILMISSVWGNVGASCEVAYSAAKGGINLFTKALAKELAPSNIAVNALACGMIDTPMNACFSKDEICEICEDIPAGRMGSVEEVAQTISLLSKAPIYLTGQILTIDGGWC